jgi:uncharacterized coiled-coil protein SlyX
MYYKKTALFLEDQLNLYREREKEHLKLISNLQAQVADLLTQRSDLSGLVKELTSQVASQAQNLVSLEETLREKGAGLDKLTSKTRVLSNLLSPQSEKIVPPPSTESKEKPKAPSPKERGNNKAKRKEFFDLETIIEDIYPDDSSLVRENATHISYVDSIRYKFIPPKFIKHIYRQHTYRYGELMYSPKAPRAPFMNSSFDSSFMAAMLQYRYIYSMPIERIVKYFAENDFNINKGTADGLLRKTATLIEPMKRALRQTILKDSYLSMDESYYTVLVKEKNAKGKGVRKGYIWAALAYNLNLIQYFYDEGSRGREVLTDYIPTDYQGAIQSDGYIDYEILETNSYPDTIRLGCLQHCKRKFMDIGENSQEARQMIDLMNELYQMEHKIDKDWSPQKKQKYRKKQGDLILDRIKKELIRIVSEPAALPSSDLLVQAANYMLGQFDALSNCLTGNYKLDNNAIERAMRYISLSRKNSLFAASHKGAERSALFYSLACSCRLQNINTFEYFNDILTQLAYINPNAPDEVFIQLLPHKWKESHPHSTPKTATI